MNHNQEKLRNIVEHLKHTEDALAATLKVDFGVSDAYELTLADKLALVEEFTSENLADDGPLTGHVWDFQEQRWRKTS